MVFCWLIQIEGKWLFSFPLLPQAQPSTQECIIKCKPKSIISCRVHFHIILAAPWTRKIIDWWRTTKKCMHFSFSLFVFIYIVLYIYRNKGEEKTNGGGRLLYFSPVCCILVGNYFIIRSHVFFLSHVWFLIEAWYFSLSLNFMCVVTGVLVSCIKRGLEKLPQTNTPVILHLIHQSCIFT